MNKKFLSAIIIIATMIYVAVALYFSKPFGNIDIKFKFPNLVQIIKNIDVKTVFIQKNSSKIVHDNVEQVSDIMVDIKSKTDGAVQNINNENTYKLSYSDREKLLGYAKILSPIDQAKIIEYLKDLDKADVKSVFKLFKTRLTDKDYEKFKAIEAELSKKVKS
ncbi:hypothetical protein M2651_01760 [Clostridium sp. SYSU_GA19001]|uniref:hypothetical protein n=1 Tax=Clostridium caldaquaticum TaxID=2940653 RepID=UPI0020775519|nr:hypothetical protein [Clostridium caldaquaticum]MCM8709747.1 hypothetical protein [Clostridium caldaquaticum]